MERINLSFIIYGGLTYGGTHHQAINLAKVLDKEKFNVRYFWCKHNYDKYSNFVFPELSLNFLKELNNFGVETVEFKVGYRDISKDYHPWRETNFFEIFNKYQTDIVFSVRAGHPEFPFIHINKPVIEWNVFGGVDNSENLVFSVSVSPWVEKERLNKGGKKENSGYCYNGLEEIVNQENLRYELGFGKKDFVLGFHQRNDDHIFADHALLSWKRLQDKFKAGNIKFTILGGSDKYKTLARKLNLQIKFLPVNPDRKYVSSFLNTLDVFTHSAGAGESLGIAVQEAMMHQLPVVSMVGKNNGHLDVIGDVIDIAKSQEEYYNILEKIYKNEKFRIKVAEQGRLRAVSNFSLKQMQYYFERLFIKTYHKYNDCIFPVLSIDIYDNKSFKEMCRKFIYYLPSFERPSAVFYNFIRRFVNKIRAIFKK